MASSGLEARIASLSGVLAPEGSDLDDWPLCEGDQGELEEEEEVVDVDEETLLRMLDEAEPPLVTCSRLFREQPALHQLQLLTPCTAEALQSRGWAVIPSFLLPHASIAAREEALALHAQGAFAQPGAHGGFTDASARGDAVYWLHPGNKLSSLPGICAAVDVLEVVRADLRLLLTLQRDSAEYQCAVYPGHGAAYARHRDALPDDGATDEQRRVTAVLYCNSADWDVQTQGGALRLHVPGEGDEAWVDVVPEGGTLVLFLSGAVEHEVMACHAPRVAISAWCQ